MTTEFHIVMTRLQADAANIVAATKLAARINEESFLLAGQFAEKNLGCGISAPLVVVEELLSRHHSSMIQSLKLEIKTYKVDQ